MKSRRVTARKAIIEEFLARDYSGGPVLLEELRWIVLREQCGTGFVEMTDSKRKSFTRTIRKHTPELTIHKFSIDDKTPVGLVARAAVYRQRSWDQLSQFLNGQDPCILCRFQSNVEVLYPRYRSWNRYVVPQYHAATFRFFSVYPTVLTYEEIQLIPGTFIPATQKLSLVVSPGTKVDLRSVATVPWKLFGYEKLEDWHQVAPTDGLWAVERNRRL